MNERIFFAYLKWTAPRHEGWYWWVQYNDDRMFGPFNTEDECLADLKANNP